MRSAKSRIIFGANTDVGKTVISSALCRALGAQNKMVRYIKPVQTGEEFDADAIKKACPSTASSHISTVTLFQWPTPISPHLAAAIANDRVPIKNGDIIRAIEAELFSPSFTDHWKLIESAGGAMSPGPGQDQLQTQADLYRSLNLPVVMVGDSKLGGISTTLSALECLSNRGYTVDAVILFKEELGNAAAIEALADTPVHVVPALPLEGPLNQWFEYSQIDLQHLVHSLENLSH